MSWGRGGGHHTEVCEASQPKETAETQDRIGRVVGCVWVPGLREFDIHSGHLEAGKRF